MRQGAVYRLMLLSAAVGLGGCVQSHFNLATRHQDYTLTSTDKEVAVGRKLARRVEQELPLLEDAQVQERVRSLGSRIAGVCDRRELIYQFAVVAEDAPNAFSLPGGYVFLHNGLVKETANDEELAGVIAHEVAHIVARHAVKRYEASLGLQAAQLLTLATRQGELAHGISVAGLSAQLAYARQDELEADRLAVKYLRAAGFNPTGVLTFLEKLKELERDNTQYLPRGVVRPHYARTHPFIPERIRAVKEALYGVADYLDYLNTSD